MTVSEKEVTVGSPGRGWGGPHGWNRIPRVQAQRMTKHDIPDMEFGLSSHEVSTATIKD